jgi:hypothetical protein
MPKQERLNKIGIFSNYDAVFLCREGDECLIRGAVSLGKIKGVGGFKSGRA